MSAAPDLYAVPRLAPHPVQSRLFHDRKRFKIFPAGRRSGKTEIAKRILTRIALDFANPREDGEERRYCIATPVLHQTRRVYERDILRRIPPILLDSVNISAGRIRLVNGTELYLLGMDVPERVEGSPWDGILLDEFADMKPRVWAEHVRPALMDRQGWALVTGVPNGRNHYWELWNEAQENPDEWGAYHWTSADILCRLGRASEVESARRAMDERTFRQEMEASFEDASGRIYYAFSRDLDVHEFEYPEWVGSSDGRAWMGGMDFNVDPMTSCWGWQEERAHPDGGTETHVYVWDEIHLKGEANTEAAGREIQRRITEGLQKDRSRWPYEGRGKVGIFEMHPDPTGTQRRTSAPAGRTDHSILRDLGFRVCARAAPPPRRDRYNSVNCMFKNGEGRRRIHVHPRCQQLVRCLEGLIYKEGTSDPDLVKSFGMDHLTDALGYWIERHHSPASGPVQAMKF